MNSVRNLITIEVEIYTPDELYVADIEAHAEHLESVVKQQTREWAGDYTPKLGVNVDFTTQYGMEGGAA